MKVNFDGPNFQNLKTRLRVYFIRHGESEGNSQGILQGLSEFPLSERGRWQSQHAAEWLSDKNIDVVFCSPLLRARETAEIICRPLGIEEPTQMKDLHELDAGIFSGLTAREIQIEYPDEWQQFRRKSWESVPKAEKISSLWERAISVWNQIIVAANQGQRHIAAVTHGGLLQWLIKSSFSAAPSWMPLIPTENCSIHEFIAHPIPAPDEEPDPKLPGSSFYASWLSFNMVPWPAEDLPN